MPLSIDGMNIGQYSYRPLGNTNNGLQANAIDRATPAAQRLSDAQEQLLERRRLEEERQERLSEAREEKSGSPSRRRQRNAPCRCVRNARRQPERSKSSNANSGLRHFKSSARKCSTHCPPKAWPASACRRK